MISIYYYGHLLRKPFLITFVIFRSTDCYNEGNTETNETLDSKYVSNSSFSVLFVLS